VHYARDKKYDKAIEEFSKAIDAQPKDPKNYLNRAQVYLLNNQPNKALPDYNKLIELEPKNADAYAARGQIEIDHATYDKAIQDINRALELEPKRKNLLRFRAFGYLRQKQWKKAVEDYNVVVKENPKDLEAWSGAPTCCNRPITTTPRSLTTPPSSRVGRRMRSYTAGAARSIDFRRTTRKPRRISEKCWN